ncbi:TIGR01777 family oxidoreductase [Thaumasiovibrio subtropicus]|uniref:TIGR01777 family oxidoreductase n=1 Tax=Thaumasiovibrio subtropicus TaxID=1891207 RepID=UPI000B35431D|nr:TIGR01777 family oxidoreductase [Thaumasiovibrio subtropicus]
MKILVTGGTGLIGRALLPHFTHDEVTILSRNSAKAYQQLGHHLKVIESLNALPDLNAYDVVINLAGEPIANKRWTTKQKALISQSRWDLTAQLVDKILASETPPHTFISGSAVGYYGDQQSQEIDESLEIDSDEFAHKVCSEWEEIALRAQTADTRVCLLRTGVVLSRQGGALAKMLPVYQMGLGGPIGNGRQYFPWIHIQDMVKGILFLIKNPHTKGIFNFTAPNTVTNREFSTTLAKVLRRPHVLMTPEWALKLSFGEAACLLLDSQKVLPKRLTEAGYNFSFPKLEPALKETLFDY